MENIDLSPMEEFKPEIFKRKAYAGISVRLFAKNMEFILVQFFLLLAVLSVAFLFQAFVLITNSNFDISQYLILIINLPTFLLSCKSIAIPVVLTLFVIYEIVFLTSNWQATFGRRVMCIYVGDVSGEKAFLWQIIGRNIFLGLSVFIMFHLSTNIISLVNELYYYQFDKLKLTYLILSILGFLSFFLVTSFNKQSAGFHDLLCGTRVFYGKK